MREREANGVLETGLHMEIDDVFFELMGFEYFFSLTLHQAILLV